MLATRRHRLGSAAYRRVRDGHRRRPGCSGPTEAFRGRPRAARLRGRVPLEAAGDGPARELAVARPGCARSPLLDGEAVPTSAPSRSTSRDRPAWDRLVLDGVRTIPRGTTASYGEVARRIGRPGAARAVGGAVGRNPVGLLVPCHRVIAGDGTLGGYGAAAWGGVEAALDAQAGAAAARGRARSPRRGCRQGDSRRCGLGHRHGLDDRVLACTARRRATRTGPAAPRTKGSRDGERRGQEKLFGEGCPAPAGTSSTRTTSRATSVSPSPSRGAPRARADGAPNGSDTEAPTCV